MNQTYYIANAFCDPAKPFSGNPAAVVILNSDNDLSDETKQGIAMEFNLSETVFISKLEDRFLIRWFTSQSEVQLCGHATLAAASVLFTQQHPYSHLIEQSKPLLFRTLFGDHLEASFDGKLITLDFPSNEPSEIDKHNCKWISEMKKAILGQDDTRSIVSTHLSNSIGYLLLELAEEVNIEQIQPKFDQMLQVGEGKSELVVAILAQKADFSRTGVHYLTRVFAPWVGTKEDPVTGSAYTVAGPYWAKQSNSRGPFLVRQASNRSGLVTVRVASGDRVYISGRVELFSTGLFQ